MTSVDVSYTQQAIIDDDVLSGANTGQYQGKTHLTLASKWHGK